MPRLTITYPCSNCAVAFKLNALQSARIRKNPNAPVYCGRKCAGVAKSPKYMCAHCHKEFDALPEQRRNARSGKLVYCSRTCFHAERVTYKCEQCAQVFVSTAYERRQFRSATWSKIRCAPCRTLML